MSAAPKIDPTNPLLDKNLINAFLGSVKKTLKSMANTEVVAEKAFIEKQTQTRGDVSGIIGMVAGNMSGTLSLTFEKGAIFFIIQNMLGETYTTLTPDVSDAVGELTNMIYGDAKTTLNQQGFNFKAAIPQVVMGEHSITSFHTGATLVVPFSCDKGKFYVEVTLQI